MKKNNDSMKLADVSSLFEQFIDADGNGIIGFTIHYSQDNFENVLFRFDPANHHTIHNDIEAKRQACLKAIAKHQITINQHITKVKTSRKRRLL